MTMLTTEPTRYVHKATGHTMVKLAAGDVYATGTDERLTTVLGSCVSICLRSVVTLYGGINHYMLPNAENEEPDDARFGETAIAKLVSAVLEGGGTTADLEAKVFGGARVINASTDVGRMNIICAETELSKLGIPIAASDVGLTVPRKIIFNPNTGKVQLLRLRAAYYGLVAERERKSLDRLYAAQGKTR